MTVLITLTLAGSDVGPFNIYSNVDGYTTPTATGVSKAALLAGYSATVPTDTVEVLVKSTGVCNVDLYLPVAGAPEPTTTTTSSTTTLVPPSTGDITISYSTFSTAFTMYSTVAVPQSVIVSAAISITGYLSNTCGVGEGVGAKTLTGNLLGLTVGNTISTHAPTGTSGTWGSTTPYKFDTLTVPLSINGGPTTSYADGDTVTILGIVFTIHIGKTCI